MNSASACSQKTTGGQITGGACSIRELNNLENGNTEKRQAGFQLGSERNLRPIKPGSEKINTSDDCIFGMCLYRSLLEEATKNK